MEAQTGSVTQLVQRSHNFEMVEAEGKPHSKNQVLNLHHTPPPPHSFKNKKAEVKEVSGNSQTTVG